MADRARFAYAPGIELPASVDLSASFFGRQGGLLPVILRVGAGSDGTLNALATGSVDRERYATLTNLDLRLARNTKVGRMTITPSIELFNVFNNDVILGVFRRRRRRTSVALTTSSLPASCVWAPA